MQTIPWDLAGEPGEEEYGDTCSVPGCDKLRGRRGPGGYRGARGMCPAHSRAFERSGDPEGARVKTARELFDAVFALAERSSRPAVRDLVEAAIAWVIARRRGVYAPGELEAAAALYAATPIEELIGLPQVAVIVGLAIEYADFPDEAPQAAFDEAHDAVERAAGALVAALGLRVNPLRLRAANEPARAGAGEVA